MTTTIIRKANPTSRKIRIDKNVEEIEIDTTIPKTYNVFFLNKKGGDSFNNGLIKRPLLAPTADSNRPQGDELETQAPYVPNFTIGNSVQMFINFFTG